MSHGSIIVDQVRQSGVLVGRIRRGDKPADLPVKIEPIINSQTAKIIGLTVPPTLLAVADQAIE